MLTFTWQEIKNRGRGLTFDDVLLVPTRSEVRSRREPSLKNRLTRTLELETPIISANMDTVTEYEMAFAMFQQGGLGILHRFLSIEDQVQQLEKLKENGVTILAASIGVVDDYKTRAKALVEAGANLLTVDIAHGHSTAMMETIAWIKNTWPQVQVIGGNIATPEGTLELIQAGADAVKIGIGPGSMCTTRIITGVGVPQLTAIALCAEAAEKTGTPVIADGGLKTSGDILKAFAAGASSVMLGSMLAGTIETPGEIKHGKKHYRGMASKAAQFSWRGGVPSGMAAEGESTMLAIKGHVKDVVLEITGGIRSGMSYLNATSFSEIRQNAKFMEISGSSVLESRAHGLSANGYS